LACGLTVALCTIATKTKSSGNISRRFLLQNRTKSIEISKLFKLPNVSHFHSVLLEKMSKFFKYFLNVNMKYFKLTVLPENRKLGLMHIPNSQNNDTKTTSIVGNPDMDE
jgi:hypothetical protein